MKVSNLIKKLGKPVSINGNQYRFSNCLYCEGSNNSPPFSAEADPSGKYIKRYYCFLCGKSSTVKVDLKKNKVKEKKKISNENKLKTFGKSLYRATAGGKTDQYLKSRGIGPWALEEYKIYESDSSICVTSFKEESNQVTGYNYIKNHEGKLLKRNLGQKALIILDFKERNIVTEGLVNGLSVLQALRDKRNYDYGLIIAGDAGNLSKLASHYQYIINKSKSLIIAADYDGRGAGQQAAFSVARTYTNKVRVILPDRLGVDWNDLLLENLIDRYL